MSKVDLTAVPPVRSIKSEWARMFRVARLNYPPAALPASTEQLRNDLRTFLEKEIANGSFKPRCDTWLSMHDPAFSAKLGAAGFLGLAWDKEYGGHGRTALDRFVVVEELLAYGAPIAAHWVSDRQSGTR